MTKLAWSTLLPLGGGVKVTWIAPQRHMIEEPFPPWYMNRFLGNVPVSCPPPLEGRFLGPPRRPHPGCCSGTRRPWAYNGLVSSWLSIQEKAARHAGAGKQVTLFESRS